MNTKIFDFLKLHQLTISSAESFTGGLYASTTVSFSGASKVYKGSLVTYSQSSKIDLLKISPNTIKFHGSISNEYAKEMVVSCQRLFKTDIAISFTGNAGPLVSENKSRGIFYIGIAINDKLWVKEYYKPDLTRNQIRNFAIQQANLFLEQKLKETFK